MHRQASETRIWFQPPKPPTLDGVTLLAEPNNGNSNINGPLLPLARPDTLRIEIDNATVLQRFLDWYEEGAVPIPALSPKDFKAIFDRFQSLVTARSGHPFETFEDGLAASWESSKPRLRDHALGMLSAGTWDEASIGSGAILQQVIDAIEIQKDCRTNLTNNLLFWQNRFGHANREHRILLEALQAPDQRQEMERLLFGFYRGDADDGATFDRLAELGGKYTLIAYLFFLKDMDRYMPIQPTGFDRAFRVMGLEFATLRQCSWENYSAYLSILKVLRPLISQEAKLASVRLVDAHSLVWILATLLKLEAAGELTVSGGQCSDGRILGAREKSIIAMRLSVESTVMGSNGQVVERVVKNKDRMRPVNYTEMCCGAAVKADLHERRSKIDPRMTGLRTKPPCAVAAIADAAFLRACSRFIVAMQRTSPKQPLKSEIKCQIQTTISLHAGPTNGSRTKQPLTAQALMSAFRHGK